MNTPKPLRLLTDHFLWKLLSLVMAAMLWIAIVDEPELTTNVTAPVEFRSLGAGLDLGSDVPDRVVLQLRGPRSRLSVATGPRSAVVLDLSGQSRPGERTFTVQEVNLNLRPASPWSAQSPRKSASSSSGACARTSPSPSASPARLPPAPDSREAPRRPSTRDGARSAPAWRQSPPAAGRNRRPWL